MLKRRKLLMTKGGEAIVNETEQDRENALIAAIHADVQNDGAHIVYADKDRLQLFRHKPGQLDSLKNLDIDELERAR